MDAEKGIITRFGEWWDQQQAYRSQTTAVRPYRRFGGWLPSRGSFIFTLLMIGLLLWAQTAGALPLPGYLNAPDAPSTGTIAYQGRLADAGGNPLTNTVPMEFRLYNAPTGGAPLWEELWTGANSVQVSDGLFNVMLGSLIPIPTSLVTSNTSLFLGITAGTDDEMMPRVQLGSVPFAVQALTVPEGSIGTDKLANGAVTSVKIADKSVGSRHFAPQRYSTFNTASDSTTSSNPVPTDVSLTFSCDSACTALVQHRGLVMHSVAQGRVDVYVLVDNTVTFQELGVLVAPDTSSNGFAPISGSGYVNLSAGTHVVSISYRCHPGTPGTCAYYGDPAGVWEHLDVLVFAQP